MATPGPTTQRHTERWAGNLLRVARAKRGLTQRQLADAAGVAPSTIGRIESGAVQPALPTLSKLLAAVDLELRIRVDEYDNHDDVLDTLAQRFPDRQELVDSQRDAFGSVEVRVALADIIRSKEAAGRRKDGEALPELYRLAGRTE